MPVDLSKAFVCYTTVDRGFQRGGSLLGFPTANLRLTPAATRSLRGFAMNTVWAGYAAVDPALPAAPTDATAKPGTGAAVLASSSPSTGGAAAAAAVCHSALASPLPHCDTQVFPCVFSIGDNPHFKNVELTLEVHVLHKFQGDFYAHGVRLLGVAPFRGMTPFTGIDALIAQIHDDIRVATDEILPLPAVQALRTAAFPAAAPATATAVAELAEAAAAETAAAAQQKMEAGEQDKLMGLFSTALDAPTTMFFDWIQKRGPSQAAAL